MDKCLQTAGKILLGAILVTGLVACGESENSQVGELEPTISLEDTRPATEEPTPNIRVSPTSEITNTPEIVTAVEITVDAANLRSEPGSESAIVGIVGAEENLELIEISEDGQWLRVESEGGLIGWVGSSVASITERESPQGDQSDDEDVELDETPTIVVDEGGDEDGPDISGEMALVTYVADGDTIVVEVDGVEERVRYIGINAPELEDSCGAEASRANRSLVDGQEVTLVKDVSERDGFKRLLRHVYVGDVLVSEELVKQGWAFPISYEPDTAMDAVLVDARVGAPTHDCQLPAAVEPTDEPPAVAQPTAPAPPAAAEPAPEQPAPTEPPAPSGPPAGVAGSCTCSGPDLNCSAFGTHAQAQACHDYCKGLGYGDIYGLDGHNNNGLACESLP